jgi:serine/threonine-protein kinase
MPDPVPLHSAADRNLLFGILALQMDFIGREALIAAMHAWVLDKGKPLGRTLVDQGALKENAYALLDPLVQAHLEAHGGHAQKSLAAISLPGSAVDALRAVADADVQTSLVQVSAARHESEDPFDTKPFLMGVPTSTGLRFRILRPHNKGGLGEVFVARDEELPRDVALKQIQERHADDPESQARFVLEAEVTGGLEHPGIVPVYGLGKYADGRPFYAMRFIQGDNLKEAIKRFHEQDSTSRPARGGRQPPDPTGERNVQFRQLLRRFIDVCNAIAYAHSRGVLHRDLKPGNVMLGKYGETLVVDWGLAKIGVRGEFKSVDLAEEPTLRPQSESGYAKTQMGVAIGTPAFMSPEQAIGQLDHLGPASDIYSLGATLYVLLTGRPPITGEDVGSILARARLGDFLAPAQAKAGVPQALDAICRKAMALKPEDRYASAQDLATDIEHWLADEPVVGYREPVATRLARWGRRHRPLMAGVAALLLTTVAALGVGLVLLGQAASRTEQQRRRAEGHFAEAQRQRDLALSNFQMARRAVDDNFVRISENTLLKSSLPGLQPLRKQLLEDALKYYQEFLLKAGDDPELKTELAGAYLRVGSITAEIGSKPDALNAYNRARELYEALTEADPQSASHRGDLARTCRLMGFNEILTGRWPEGIASSRKAISLGGELVQSNPEVPEFQQDLAWSYNTLGIGQAQSGHLALGQRAFKQAIATWEPLIQKHPRPEFRIGLGVAYNNLGETLIPAGRMDDALDASLKAVALHEKGVAENRADPDFQRRLVLSLENLGQVYFFSDQWDKAREAFERARAVAEPLQRENSLVVEFRERLVLNYIDLGHLLLRTGEHAQARDFFEKALEKGKELPPGPPNNFSYASIYRGLGKVFRKQGQTADALEALQKAVKIGETDPGGDKPFTTYELACARALCSAASAERQVKDSYADKAMEALGQAVAEGWVNVPWIKRDPDLDALRNLTEFKKLLVELEDKASRAATVAREPSVFPVQPLGKR